jgi:hypothetical protein
LMKNECDRIELSAENRVNVRSFCDDAVEKKKCKNRASKLWGVVEHAPV